MGKKHTHTHTRNKKKKKLQTKSYLSLQITKHFKDLIDQHLNKQNIKNAAYQLPYILLFHKHDLYCVSQFPMAMAETL